MSVDHRMRALLEQMDEQQRAAANEVVKIERRNSSKSRNKFLDEEIVSDIITAIKKLVPDEKEAKA